MSQIALIGFGLQALGGLRASRAEELSLREDAVRSKENAELDKKKALIEADNLMLQSRKVLSSQKTGFAAAGLAGESAVAVMFDSRVNAELDSLSIIFGGDVRSRNFALESESKLRAASDVREAGLFNVAAAGFRAAGYGIESGSIGG